MLNIEKTRVGIGLEKPLKVLHITDSHLPLCEEGDDPRILAHGMKRDREAGLAALREEIEYGEENCDLILHTGDLIDFVTPSGVAILREMLKNPRFLFIAGNHEYWRCDGQFEDMAYRMNSYMKMGDLGADIFFASRVVGGVNFVGIDDAYHQVEDWQTERLKRETEKGLPVVLFLHAPLFEQSLYEKSIPFWKDGSAYLVGCDEEHLLSYPEFRACEQRPTEATKRFVEYVNAEKQIKAVIAGHLHFSFESRLPGGTMQYVTARGDRGNGREILFF